MSWSSLILASLKMAVSLIQYVNRQQSLEAGQDKAIAQAALAVLEATQYGKDLRARVAQLTDGEADDLWDRMVER